MSTQVMARPETRSELAPGSPGPEPAKVTAPRGILPTRSELAAHQRARYGDLRQQGWRVRLRQRFGYFDAEAWYEFVVERLVTDGCAWIDVGGGKSILPRNRSLAERLARRCGHLVGVDPSETLQENVLVHERAQCFVEDYRSERKFDLATLRMVAEHITDPDRAIASLAALLKPGGKAVIYTPNRWSPLSLLAGVVPFRWHHRLTHVLWQTKEEDVFPTVYRMNSRRRLRTLFERGGFRQIDFGRLDSCCIFQRFPALYFLELSLWRGCSALGVPYPENNLLGVYERR